MHTHVHTQQNTPILTTHLYIFRADYQFNPRGSTAMKKKIAITHNLRLLKIKSKAYGKNQTLHNFMLEEVRIQNILKNIIDRIYYSFFIIFPFFLFILDIHLSYLFFCSIFFSFLMLSHYQLSSTSYFVYFCTVHS